MAIRSRHQSNAGTAIAKQLWFVSDIQTPRTKTVVSIAVTLGVFATTFVFAGAALGADSSTNDPGFGHFADSVLGPDPSLDPPSSGGSSGHSGGNSTATSSGKTYSIVGTVLQVVGNGVLVTCIAQDTIGNAHPDPGQIVYVVGLHGELFDGVRVKCLASPTGVYKYQNTSRVTSTVQSFAAH